jgi:hypothetical protein
MDVLVDSSQIDDCIDQACDFFGEHAGGIGNEESIILISPELVYYDGTGNASHPAPTAGKWRKPTTITSSGSSGTSGSPGTSGTSACIDCPPANNELVNGVTKNYPVVDGNGDICPTETLPGSGWCGDNIPPPHCFTEQGEYDPNAEGPFWVEGDTTAKPSMPGWVWKTVYDIPPDVIAIDNRLTAGYLNATGNTEDNALFAPAGMLLQGGGSWGFQNSGSYTDNRWGYWMGSNGGFVDIVGWQIAMQYIEMFRQLFTVKMDAQLLELQHKVRLTPPPAGKGVIALSCTRRVVDEAMYEHQWVREYALALTMINIGMNAGKYANLVFPGGGSINGDMYFTRGDALRDKLEQQIDDGRYNFPADFFVG